MKLRRCQLELAARAVREDALGEVRRIAGVDVSSSRFDPARMVHAAVVVLDWPSLTPVARAAVSLPAPMPYITGLLAFREIPAIEAALAQLPDPPDLLMVDGQGIAHPRRCGIATHLGVVTDLPSIGVAKSRLVGQPVAPLGEEPGALVEVRDRGDVVGALLRSRARANPLHISPGHRVSLATALHWVRATLRGRRLPEPTRAAHEWAGQARRAAMAPPPGRE
ncbi:deoxyribonuclease V [Roseococcus suduntuyensis]|uniref:Endonuclease V n=1 Tax=Roseococcus suduntuyensis TaxID=455361 RepID=A0A840ABY1_9PROT|nr:deoxyribonuclease V [Roseococcus suduntuyensis]MBB3898597.1 deoxyribonuclease V [Roseococcus suduntuyensis]